MSQDNSQVQFKDISESLQSIIGDLSYQVAYRDGVIKALERLIEERDQKITEMQMLIGDLKLQANIIEAEEKSSDIR